VSRERIRPTSGEVANAAGRSVPDVLERSLRVVFVGINPGLYSAAVGHHFARPGNRFWKALHGAGFTERVLDASEDGDLPRYGLGVTNLVARATAAAAELDAHELRAGAVRLADKMRAFRPDVVAVLGLGAFRTAFGRPSAVVGPQPDALERSRVWLLPNPSGLNAHHQLPALVGTFAELRAASFDRGSIAPAG
jgi:double-stranded uracil-DNA glycosylase